MHLLMELQPNIISMLFHANWYIILIIFDSLGKEKIERGRLALGLAWSVPRERTGLVDFPDTL